MGTLDPQIRMNTDFGQVAEIDTGGGQIAVLQGSGSYQVKIYPFECSVLYPEATGLWGYPTGVGCHAMGRSVGFEAGGNPYVPPSGSMVLWPDGTVRGVYF